MQVASAGTMLDTFAPPVASAPDARRVDEPDGGPTADGAESKGDAAALFAALLGTMLTPTPAPTPKRAVGDTLLGDATAPSEEGASEGDAAGTAVAPDASVADTAIADATEWRTPSIAEPIELLRAATGGVMGVTGDAQGVGSDAGGAGGVGSASGGVRGAGRGAPPRLQDQPSAPVPPHHANAVGIIPTPTTDARIDAGDAGREEDGAGDGDERPLTDVVDGTDLAASVVTSNLPTRAVDDAALAAQALHAVQAMHATQSAQAAQDAQAAQAAQATRPAPSTPAPTTADDARRAQVDDVLARAQREFGQRAATERAATERAASARALSERAAALAGAETRDPHDVRAALSDVSSLPTQATDEPATADALPLPSTTDALADVRVAATLVASDGGADAPTLPDARVTVAAFRAAGQQTAGASAGSSGGAGSQTNDSARHAGRLAARDGRRTASSEGSNAATVAADATREPAVTPVASSGEGVSGARGAESSAATTAARAPAGTAGVERVARLLDVRDAAAAAPVSHITLRLGAGGEEQIRVGLRGLQVGASINVADRASADQMRASVGELRAALDRHGLATGRVEIGAAAALPTAATRDAGDATRTLAAIGAADRAVAAGGSSASSGGAAQQNAQQHTRGEQDAHDAARDAARDTPRDGERRGRRDAQETADRRGGRNDARGRRPR